MRKVTVSYDSLAGLIELRVLAFEPGAAQAALMNLPGMTEAQALYLSFGFQEISAYYRNPVEGVRYMALDLTRKTCP